MAVQPEREILRTQIAHEMTLAIGDDDVDENQVHAFPLDAGSDRAVRRRRVAGAGAEIRRGQQKEKGKDCHPPASFHGILRTEGTADDSSTP